MSLMLHCGAEEITLDALRKVKTPKATESFVPVPHADFVESVTGQLTENGYNIKSLDHGLGRDGQRYFGVATLEGKSKERDTVIGLRNTHDNSFAAGLCIGSRVFVCDNLAFHGDSVQVARRHTRHIIRDLDHVVARAIGDLRKTSEDMDERIACYKNTEIDDRQAHDLVCRALLARAVTPTRVPNVLGLWHGTEMATDPDGNEVEFQFDDFNVWTLQNAFTEVYKGRRRSSSKRQVPCTGCLMSTVVLRRSLALITHAC